MNYDLVGDRCKTHGDVFEMIFEELMAWPSFVTAMLNDEKFKEVVAKAVLKLAEGDVVDQKKLKSITWQFLELKTPVEALTAEQLKGALGAATVPKNMASVPTIQVSARKRSMVDEIDAEGEEEPIFIL